MSRIVFSPQILPKTVVDLAQPANSIMVQKVGGGHLCWLASNSACSAWLATRIGGGQFVVEQRQVFQSTPNTEVVCVVRAGFGPQDPIAVLVAADVLFGE